MAERLQTMKYIFTVEGETERWYLLWLRDQVNSFRDRVYNIAVDARVQQSPAKFYKGITPKTTPEVTHICDVESVEPAHMTRFHAVLSEMKEAQRNKRIVYRLGYSNFSFELWMVLHKKDCSGPLAHRNQYLSQINQAFSETFEDMEHYKGHDGFHRCLSKMTLDDVKAAVRRAETINSNNLLNGNALLEFKGYKYYRDNPSLSIHESVRNMLTKCGVL